MKTLKNSGWKKCKKVLKKIPIMKTLKNSGWKKCKKVLKKIPIMQNT